LGPLVSASMASRQRWTSATEASSSRAASLRPAETEKVDEAEYIAAVGALGVGAGAAGDPALEHFGEAAVEAFGAGPDRGSQMAGQDRRQLVGFAQDDQAAVCGRGIRVGQGLAGSSDLSVLDFIFPPRAARVSSDPVAVRPTLYSYD
jgi:hypothetical protein